MKPGKRVRFSRLAPLKYMQTGLYFSVLSWGGGGFHWRARRKFFSSPSSPVTLLFFLFSFDGFLSCQIFFFLLFFENLWYDPFWYETGGVICCILSLCILFGKRALVNCGCRNSYYWDNPYDSAITIKSRKYFLRKGKPCIHSHYNYNKIVKISGTCFLQRWK